MMDQEHKESIEQTIVELESQQMAVQQLVAEALSELEVVYSEIEEQARLVAEAEAAGTSGESTDDPAEIESQAMERASEELQQLQKEIAALQDERRELESQLRQLRQELEEGVTASEADAGKPSESGGDKPLPSSASMSTHPLLSSTSVPNAAAIHAPFERLREQISNAS